MPPPQTSRRLGALVVGAALVGAAGCGGAAPTATGTTPATPSSTRPPASTASAPSTSGTTTVVQDGVRVQVPAGWRATAVTRGAQAEALARESDPQVIAFLRNRMEGMAATGGILYLYDLRGLATSDLATAEVYRYPVGRTPEEAVRDVVLPQLQQAGLSPVRGQTTLPGGPALTVVGQTRASGKDVRNDVYVLSLGPTAVGLSVTTIGAARSDTAALPQSLATG